MQMKNTIQKIYLINTKMLNALLDTNGIEKRVGFYSVQHTIVVFLLVMFPFISNAQKDTTLVIALQKKAMDLEGAQQPDSAVLYNTKALGIAQKNGYTLGVAKSYLNLGITYMHTAKYPLALANYYKALPIYESKKNNIGMLRTLANIGSVCESQGEFDKAITYGFKALKIAEVVNEKKRTAIICGNIGIAYSRQHKFELAKTYILKALALDSAINNTEGLARNLTNLGFIHTDKQYDKQALVYFSQSLVLATQLNDTYSIATCLGNMGSAYQSLKQYAQAEKHLLQAVKLANQTGDINLVAQFEIIVSEFYKTVKNDKQELAHYKTFVSLRDSMYNEENLRASAAAELNYTFDKKEAATKFQNDKIIYKLEADNKLHKQQRWFLLIAIALVLGLLYMAKRAYDNKKAIAEFMSTENDRKEVLLQEVHHRINNNLQIISSLLTLQANSAENTKLQEYLLQSQNRIQSLSVLHELLYQNNSPLQVNMHEYITKVLDYHKDIVSTLPAKINIDIEVSSTNFATKIAVPVALIINELVTNSIKYAFANATAGTITITLLPVTNEHNHWQLYVSDTGKGLPQDNEVRKDSLGLRLVTIMAKQIKGTLTKSNTPGATFSIVFSNTI
jgi:two-component sensor histidine kinase